MTALGPYVVFAGFSAAEPRPDEGALRKGMTRADAERALGIPASVTEHEEGALHVVTLVFVRSNERVTADFVADVLVRYVAASR